MLKVTYHVSGTLMPDERVESWIQNKITAYNKLPAGEHLCVTVANELSIYAIRVLVREGKIPSDQVEIYYTNKANVLCMALLNNDGRFMGDYGPESAFDNFLGRLLF